MPELFINLHVETGFQLPEWKIWGNDVLEDGLFSNMRNNAMELTKKGCFPPTCGCDITTNNNQIPKSRPKKTIKPKNRSKKSQMYRYCYELQRNPLEDGLESDMRNVEIIWLISGHEPPSWNYMARGHVSAVTEETKGRKVFFQKIYPLFTGTKVIVLVIIFINISSAATVPTTLSRPAGSILEIKPVDFFGREEFIFAEIVYISQPKKCVGTWFNCTVLYEDSERVKFYNNNSLDLLLKMNDLELSDTGDYMIKIIETKSNHLLTRRFKLEVNEIESTTKQVVINLENETTTVELDIHTTTSGSSEKLNDTTSREEKSAHINMMNDQISINRTLNDSIIRTPNGNNTDNDLHTPGTNKATKKENGTTVIVVGIVVPIVICVIVIALYIFKKRSNTKTYQNVAMSQNADFNI